MSVSPLTRDEHSAEFFDAAARGVLLLRWSTECGGYLPPAAVICPCAPLAPLEWREASGLGEVVTWTVIPVRGTDAVPPTVVAYVELAEGPWITVRVRGIDPAKLRAGHPVRIGFETPEGGGETIPIALPPHPG
ncbi:Zn-ribbon domain-containing OB-fold protein [Streptomyces himastatinicus]|uniref:Zn-ribbon domain-containing OB-fold protein n=1 Tax=Streptomyces himastatinicus TaxID=998084 RepID=UPI0001B4B2E1|nr:OB-fold domain-containing protein [Streptomyces himastatinicus]